MNLESDSTVNINNSDTEYITHLHKMIKFHLSIVAYQWAIGDKMT